jgi:hypothetical protein
MQVTPGAWNRRSEMTPVDEVALRRWDDEERDKRLRTDGASQACTPGYSSNEGRAPGPAARANLRGFSGGPLAFFRSIDRRRSSGQFEGLELR